MELYEINGQIARGGFSEVFGGTERATGRGVALKRVSKARLSEKDMENLQREVDILQELKHPCILELLDVFEDSKHIYLVSDRLYGGELFDRIVQKTNYGEGDARDVIKLVLETIAYLHKNHIVHRDLKPENLLLVNSHEDSNVKIADFGLACKLVEGGPLLTQACGSPDYVAPEICARQRYGKPVDVWSIGVITYVLLCGYPPFAGDSRHELFQNIMQGNFDFYEDDWSQVSQEAQDFVRAVLVVDPQRRATAEQLLRHSWMQIPRHSFGGHSPRALGELRRYNARRRLKGALQLVVGVDKATLKK